MLTDLSDQKTAAPGQRKEVPDGRISGLYLVVQPSGAKSWALRYRADGPDETDLGPYPALDLATARKMAQEALGDVAGGSRGQTGRRDYTLNSTTLGPTNGSSSDSPRKIASMKRLSHSNDEASHVQCRK